MKARAAETTSTMSTDEAFQSKESSQEELDQRTGRAIQAPPRPTSSRPSRSELHDSDEYVQLRLTYPIIDKFYNYIALIKHILFWRFCFLIKVYLFVSKSFCLSVVYYYEEYSLLSISFLVHRSSLISHCIFLYLINLIFVSDEYFLTRTRYDPEPTQLEVNSSDSSKYVFCRKIISFFLLIDDSHCVVVVFFMSIHLKWKTKIFSTFL